jgi:hypothetical protein
VISILIGLDDAHLKMSPTSLPLIDRQNASSPPVGGKNPITLRLSKILGTSFDDTATREALQTLSDVYAQGGSSGDKPPDSGVDGTDGDQFGSAKKSGSSFVVSGELAARARKNIRRDMENKLAEGAQQFMKVLGAVNEVSIGYPITPSIY